MHVLKPYLDSLRSESDWSGFVVRFGVTYLMQIRFRPVCAQTRTHARTHTQTNKQTKVCTKREPRTQDKKSD